MPKHELLRFNGAVEHDPAIDAWLNSQRDDLAAIAWAWLQAMRACGDEVRELMHDGVATACLGDVPFAYVGIYKAHVSLGFFQGAQLPDPHHLLEGQGRFMRHLKLRPTDPTRETAAIHALITAAWHDIKSRVEQG